MSDRVATDQGDQPDVVVVRLPEDFQTSPDDMQPLLDDPLIRGEVRIVVDMSRPNYLSSGGIAYLLHCRKRARACGGDIRMFAAPKFVQHVLETVGLSASHGFALFKTEAEAIRSFSE